jgi:hypothetical protein
MPDANDAFEKPVYDAAQCIEEPVTTAENTPEDAAVLNEATELLGGTASVERLIAADIAAGKTAPRLTPQFILDQIRTTQFYVFPDTTVTVCCLTLLNGYNVTGTSACISPSNFNIEIGMQVARENAIKEIWALEGYLLKEMIHTTSLVEATIPAGVENPFQPADNEG